MGSPSHGHIGTFCGDGSFNLPLKHKIPIYDKYLLLLYARTSAERLSFNLLYKENRENTDGFINDCFTYYDDTRCFLSIVPLEGDRAEVIFFHTLYSHVIHDVTKIIIYLNMEDPMTFISVTGNIGVCSDKLNTTVTLRNYFRDETLSQWDIGQRSN